MKVKQVYEFVNSALAEAIGKSDLLQEDLQNVVDAGNEVFGADAVDNYVKSLVNHIGRVIFVDRVYEQTAIKGIMRDGWEFGSVLQKVQMDLLDAKQNPSWNLVNGQSYEEHIFYQPTVTASFWNHKLTLEIPISIATMQVKESFSNSGQLNSFVSMIYNTVKKTLTVQIDELIMRVVNDMAAKTVAAEYIEIATPSPLGNKTGTRAINLLYMYNEEFGTNLTAKQAVKNADFIRYAAFQMRVVSDRMVKINNAYNMGAKSRFTPKDLQTVVLWSEFESAASVYLYSDVFHNELVRLPEAQTVPYWQAIGEINNNAPSAYAFDKTTALNVITSTGTEVNMTGVIGMIFDRDACMVANQYSRVTSSYSAAAEFYTNYYKEDISLFNDPNEQFVVFFVADPTEEQEDE